MLIQREEVKRNFWPIKVFTSGLWVQHFNNPKHCRISSKTMLCHLKSCSQITLTRIWRDWNTLLYLLWRRRRWWWGGGGIGSTGSWPAQCTRGRTWKGACVTVMTCCLVGGTGVGTITRGKLRKRKNDECDNREICFRWKFSFWDFELKGWPSLQNVGLRGVKSLPKHEIIAVLNIETVPVLGCWSSSQVHSYWC